jgi:hypothetical protein
MRLPFVSDTQDSNNLRMRTEHTTLVKMINGPEALEDAARIDLQVG